MIVSDTLHLALRNLRQSKLRTALTTLGVSIGIASLAGMVSLGVGLQEQFVGRFTQSGVFDSITVLSGGDLPGFMAGGRGGGRGRTGRGAAASGTPARDLDDEALKTLAALDEVKEAYPGIRVPVQMQYGEFTQFTPAAGVPMSSRGLGAFQTMSYGTFFVNDTDAACLLSLDMAKRLDEQNPQNLIGRAITLSYAVAAAAAAAPTGPESAFGVQRVNAKFTVVGIVERETTPGFGGGATVAGLMIPLAQAKDIDARMVTGPQSLLRDASAKHSYQSIVVKVKRAQSTQDVEDRIKKLGYSAFSLNDALQGAKRAFIILDIVLSLIGSIALAVSSLGIVNTMVMSILERTREIGIMKAIGGSDSDIRRIFLVEASAIGVLGGVGGVLLGWIVGRVINFGANIYIQNQGGTPGNLFSLPLWLVGGAIGFSWMVSLIAGSYPAARAAKLDPIQALRHD